MHSLPTVVGDVISIGKLFKKVAQPRTRLRGNPILKVIMVARAKCEADFHLFTLRYFVTLNSVRPITSAMQVLPYGTARHGAVAGRRSLSLLSRFTRSLSPGLPVYCK